MGFIGDIADDWLGLDPDEPEPNRYGEQAAQIAQKMFEQTNPLRENLVERYTKFLTPGRFRVTQSPLWQPGKQALETAYRQAQQNITSSIPAGGALLESLAGAETSRAKDLTSLAGQIAQDEYGKVYGMATGTPQTSLAGLSTAASGEASAQQALAAQNAAKQSMFGDLGMGTGMILASK